MYLTFVIIYIKAYEQCCAFGALNLKYLSMYNVYCIHYALKTKNMAFDLNDL